MNSSIETTPTQAPPRARGLRQHAMLQKGAYRVVRCPTKRTPPRSDIPTWLQPKAVQARPKVTNTQLVDAVQWMHKRRGVAWSSSDDATRDELKARAWGKKQAIDCTRDSIPRWVAGLLPGRRYASARLVALVLAAHRASSPGCLISYTEVAGVFDVSPRTAQRWAHALEADGLLELIQTWKANPKAARDGEGPRSWDKMLYRPGPKLREAAGLGMLEGAKGLSPKARRISKRRAVMARANVKRAMWGRCNDLYGEREAYRLPAAGPSPETLSGGGAGAAPRSSLLSLDTKSSPSPLRGSRDIGAPAAPHDRVSGDGPAAPLSQARADTNPPARVAHPGPAEPLGSHWPPSEQVAGQVLERSEGRWPEENAVHENPGTFKKTDGIGEPNDGPALLGAFLAELERPPPKRKFRETRHGVDVVKCTRCHGGGMSAGVGSPLCPACGGRGRVEKGAK